MEFAYRDGDKVFVIKKLFCHIKVGNVVVLKDPRTERLLLKRVMLIKGSTYYVEGDNKKESTDSRHFGWVDKQHIVGKALLF